MRVLASNSKFESWFAKVHFCSAIADRNTEVELNRKPSSCAISRSARPKPREPIRSWDTIFMAAMAMGMPRRAAARAVGLGGDGLP